MVLDKLNFIKVKKMQKFLTTYVLQGGNFHEKGISLNTSRGSCFFSLMGIDSIIAMKMPKTVLMNASQGKTKNPVYAPVNFPHQKHLKLGCPVCHHKWTDKKNPPKKMC